MLTEPTILNALGAEKQTKTTFETNKAWIYFSPNKTNSWRVNEFLASAKSDVDIATYSLTSDVISAGIRATQSRKVAVRLVCDKQQAQIKSAKCTELGGKIDKKSGLMHNKFIVVDQKCVLTGSYNFTANATNTNRENFIIICNEAVAKTYHDEFEKIWKNNT